jgi:hypothetical protein
VSEDLSPWELTDGLLNERYLYAGKEAVEFYVSLPDDAADRSKRLSAAQQAAQIFDMFCRGQSLHEMMLEFRPVFKPIGAHVWEVRTPDLRVFGWFPTRGNFVAVFGKWKREMEGARNAPEGASLMSYAEARAKVVTWRHAHGMANHVWKGTAGELDSFLSS